VNVEGAEKIAKPNAELCCQEHGGGFVVGRRVLGQFSKNSDKRQNK
jgi:hypothetical protein